MGDNRYTWQKTEDGREVVRVNISPVKADGTGPEPVWVEFTGTYMAEKPGDTEIEWEDLYQITDGLVGVQKTKPDQNGVWEFRVVVYFVGGC